MADFNSLKTTWRKSTKSSSGGNCVEISFLDEDLVAIRDSKNPSSPVVMINRNAWKTFIAGVKNGEFDN